MARLELAGLEKGKLNIAKEQLSDFNFDCSKIPPGCDRFDSSLLLLSFAASTCRVDYCKNGGTCVESGGSANCR